MDTHTYEWILSSNNNTTTPKLIEYILILSINNVFISIDELIQYCNNINKSNNNNNNNKRYFDNEEEFHKISNGLNRNQFQTLNNIINSFKSSLKSPLNNSIIYNHKFNENTNNNNNIKFDCSLIIIIENNKSISSIISTTHTINDSKKIKLDTINKKHYDRGGLDCSDINSTLFYRLWENIVIRNQILFHIRLFNVHGKLNITFESKEEFSNFKCNSYLKSIGNFGYIDSDSNPIPCNGTHDILLIPNGFNQIITSDMISDSITYINFGDEFNQTLDGNWIPKNTKTLIFGNAFQQPIKIGQLPVYLDELILRKNYNGIIEPGSIPKSVRNLNSKFEVDDEIDSDDTYNEDLISTNLNDIPKYTTNLKFHSEFDQELKEGDIPHNVSTINLGDTFGNDTNLEYCSLPQSITSMKIPSYSFPFSKSNLLPSNLVHLEVYNFSVEQSNVVILPSLTLLVTALFDKPINANQTLPNLTSIDIGEFNQDFIQNLFPQSISSIKIYSTNHPIPEGYFYNHSNLKSLEIYFLSNDIPSKAFPSSLTLLHLKKFNGSFSNDMISPSSSLELVLYSDHTQQYDENDLHREFKIGYLPPYITSLTLGSKFDKPIDNDSLPINLKELYITNPNYNQQIPTEQDHLPPSLDSIYISYKIE